MYEKYPVPTLKCLSMIKVARSVTSVIDKTDKNSEDGLSSLETHLLRLSPTVVDHTLEQIAHILTERFKAECNRRCQRQKTRQSVIFRQVWDWLWNWRQSQEEASRVEILKDFSRLLVHPSRKFLNLEGLPSPLQSAMVAHLDNAIALESLTLVQHVGQAKMVPMEDIIEHQLGMVSWANLSNLRNISLIRCCTDDVLCSLSRHCPLLETLDVSFSTGVTHRGLSNLAWVSKLRILGLTGVPNLQPTELASLILQLTSLEEFSQIDPLLTQALEEKMKASGLYALGLKVIESWAAFSKEQLISFTKLCPKLTYLSALVTESQCISEETVFFCDLGNLVSLQHLALGGVSGPGLKKFIVESSLTLTSLDLTGACSGLSWPSVVHILQKCRNSLQRLALWEPPDGWGGWEEELVPGHLPELTYLFLAIYPSGIFALEYFLSHCCSLALLKLIGGNVMLSQRRLQKSITSPDGCARSLEKVEVMHVNLKVSVARFFLRRCPRLRYLGILHTWGLSRRSLRRINNVVKKHYLQVRLHEGDYCLNDAD